MFKELFDPPSALLASGTKIGVDLGGSKVLISIDGNHNFYAEGNIFTELSWGEFYKEPEIADQIDTFTTKDYTSVREDPEALAKTIIDSIKKIMEQGRIFYGILDTEVDAFMNQNTVIPGLNLDKDLINKLMESHKKNRDEDNFPALLENANGQNSIKISIQGTEKQKLLFNGDNLEDFADQLHLAKGFATGIVVTSNKAANFFIMNEKITFEEETIPEFYIDQDCIWVIKSGIDREKLYPVSWFRIDIGIRSLETLELWDQIKGNDQLTEILNKYEDYITELVIKKYQTIAKSELDIFIESDMSLKERRDALKDIKETLKRITDKYS